MFCVVKDVPEQMGFYDFQISDQNYLSNLNLFVTLLSPIKFGLSLHIGRRCLLKIFQDSSRGGHLGCRNGTHLAVLNHHVFPVSHTKFQLNLTYHSRADLF